MIFNEKNIIKITKFIPQNILFILECENEAKLAVFRAGQLLQSEWSAKESHTIQLKGLNFDSLWENVIIQIGSLELEKDNTLDEQIAVDEKRAKIEKEITQFCKKNICALIFICELRRTRESEYYGMGFFVNDFLFGFIIGIVI